MADLDPRPLSARLDAYIANLASIVGQLSDLADQIELVGGDTTPLRDGIKLYGLVADDLTRIVNGERLGEFRIEGQL